MPLSVIYSRFFLSYEIMTNALVVLISFCMLKYVFIYMCVCACVYIYIYDFMIVVILIMLCRNKQECSCWNFLVLFCCKVRFRWVITIKTEFLSLYLHKVYFTFLSINVNFQWSHMDDIRYFKDLAHFAIRICLYRTDFFDCWSLFFFFPNRLETHFSTLTAKSWMVIYQCIFI